MFICLIGDFLARLDDGDAAAHADGRRRRGQRDGRGLADLAADQAEHAARGGEREVLGPVLGDQHQRSHAPLLPLRRLAATTFIMPRQ